MELLRHRSAADDIVLFEHQRLEPGGGEIGRSEAIVAGADDHDAIPPIIGRPPRSGGNVAHRVFHNGSAIIRS
jgi:hypothetical protein